MNSDIGINTSLTMIHSSMICIKHDTSMIHDTPMLLTSVSKIFPFAPKGVDHIERPRRILDDKCVYFIVVLYAPYRNK